MRAITLIQRKASSKLKERTCTDGSKKLVYDPGIEISSPTLSNKLGD